MLKKIAILCALAVNSAFAQTTTSFETPEYNLSKALGAVKASSAYVRGYTGKGSVIAVLDTGIDTSSAEFKDKILMIKNFSGSATPLDKIGHGTHVAGIAAAAKNGTGVQGVAYDAKLIIGKITENGKIGASELYNAASWANSSGADVANMSVGWSLTKEYLGAKQLATGVYTTKYTNTSSTVLDTIINTSQWKSALQSEMVIVMAAGNDGTKWSQGLAGLATATDSSGQLLLGGRVLIAGNWDTSANGVNSTSNGAAHLCQTTIKGVMNTEYCADKYKTWDYYLLAPGTRITSVVPKTVNSAGIAAMTGTSMSTPVIAGGVAIIHQMWPQMKGANIAKLLLVTADKSFSGYNLYVHGQGIMDLEKATRPYGTIGVPTTGRLAGPSLASVRPLVYTGGSASTGGLTKLMMVDEFERDFYTTGKSLTAHKRYDFTTPSQMAMVYDSRHTYSLFNSYATKLTSKIGGYELSVYIDPRDITNTAPMAEFAFNKAHADVSWKFSTGFFTEHGSWLGNSVGSFVGAGVNKDSYTQYFGVSMDKKMTDAVGIYASYNTGITHANAYSSNVTNIGAVLSHSWSIGMETKNDAHTFGAMIYQPVSVYHAQANVVAPIGLDQNFNVIQNSKVNLAADSVETRLGFYHKFQDSKKIKSTAYFEARQNYHGQAGASDTAAGVSVTSVF